VSATPDRRPWLILSQSEAEALYYAALSHRGRRSAALERALRQVDLQIRWIEDGPVPDDDDVYPCEPTVRLALERQARASAS
jgi:hypothetical protein